MAARITIPIALFSHIDLSRRRSDAHKQENQSKWTSNSHYPSNALRTRRRWQRCAERRPDRAWMPKGARLTSWLHCVGATRFERIDGQKPERAFRVTIAKECAWKIDPILQGLACSMPSRIISAISFSTTPRDGAMAKQLPPLHT